ncbi:hypothetical protein D3C80_1183550 [compost metagenome]
MVVGIVRQGDPVPGPWQVHGQDLPDGGTGAVGHHDDAIGEQHRLVHVVGDHDDGVAKLRLDRHQGILQMGPGQGVEGAERLVHQQHLGGERQRPGDTDPLFHAPRQLVGHLPAGVIHLHQGEVVVHPLRHRPLVRLHLAHRQRHVLLDAEPGQQGVVLEHHGPLGPRPRHLAAIEDDAAQGRLQQPGHQVEHRALAAARVTYEGDELPLLDAQVDPAEGLEAALLRLERDADVAYLQITLHWLFSCLNRNVINAVPGACPRTTTAAGPACPCPGRSR